MASLEHAMSSDAANDHSTAAGGQGVDPSAAAETTKIRMVQDASTFTRESIPLCIPYDWNERAVAQSQQDAVLLKDMFQNPTQMAGSSRFEGSGITLLKRRVFGSDALGNSNSSDSAKAIVAQLLQRYGMSIHDLHRSSQASSGAEGERDDSPECLYGQPLQDPASVLGFTRLLPDRSVPSLEVSSSASPADHQKMVLQRSKKEGAGAWSTMTTILKLFDSESSATGDHSSATDMMGSSSGARSEDEKVVSAKTVLRHACLTLPPSRLPGDADAKTVVLAMLRLLSSTADLSDDDDDDDDDGRDGSVEGQAPKMPYFPKLPLIKIAGLGGLAATVASSSENAITVKELERQSFEKVGEWTLSAPFTAIAAAATFDGDGAHGGGVNDISSLFATNTFLVQLRNLERRFFDSPTPWQFLSRNRFVPPGWSSSEATTIMWKGTLPVSRRKEVAESSSAPASSAAASSSGASKKRKATPDATPSASTATSNGGSDVAVKKVKKKKKKKSEQPTEAAPSHPPSLAFSSSSRLSDIASSAAEAAYVNDHGDFVLEATIVDESNENDHNDEGGHAQEHQASDAEEESLGETEDEDEDSSDDDNEGGRDFGFGMGFGAGGGSNVGDGPPATGSGGYLDDDDDDDLPDF